MLPVDFPGTCSSFIKSNHVVWGRVTSKSIPSLVLIHFCHSSFHQGLGKRGSLEDGCGIALLAADRIQDVTKDTASSIEPELTMSSVISAWVLKVSQSA
ncbi:hypothetical protein TNCV_3688281 [Trichonephila clavipes]|uniref:Uncharacterized protein n=1 Tax=Trichonephila clavipes TaxID=2585209 RepID=A0A8X6V327_TRICX|nr:hypothetical protein TNCV_3688281 [Trichonephila clavipes]